MQLPHSARHSSLYTRVPAFAVSVPHRRAIAGSAPEVVEEVVCVLPGYRAEGLQAAPRGTRLPAIHARASVM